MFLKCKRKEKASTTHLSPPPSPPNRPTHPILQEDVGGPTVQCTSWLVKISSPSPFSTCPPPPLHPCASPLLRPCLRERGGSHLHFLRSKNSHTRTFSLRHANTLCTLLKTLVPCSKISVPVHYGTSLLFAHTPIPLSGFHFLLSLVFAGICVGTQSSQACTNARGNNNNRKCREEKEKCIQDVTTEARFDHDHDTLPRGTAAFAPTPVLFLQIVCHPNMGGTSITGQA